MVRYIISWMVSILFMFYYLIGLWMGYSEGWMALVYIVLPCALFVSLINKLLVGNFFPIPRGPRSVESAKSIKSIWKTNRAIIFQSAFTSVFWFFTIIYLLSRFSALLQCSASRQGCYSYQMPNFIDGIILLSWVAMWGITKIILIAIYGKNFNQRYQREHVGKGEYSTSTNNSSHDEEDFLDHDPQEALEKYKKLTSKK